MTKTPNHDDFVVQLIFVVFRHRICDMSVQKWAILTWLRGWLSGMETDSHKSRISDGVLVQKQNCMSRCLKSYASVSQYFGTKRTHSSIPGLKGEAFF
jgi:hypothetical protein